MARAVYRGYWQGGKRSARVTRLHIIRDTPVAGHRSAYRPFRERPGVETWCGQSAQPHTNSEPVIFDPMPAVPPEGLLWCPQCIGHLAERYGLLGEIAECLAAWDPGLCPDVDGRWARRREQVAAGSETAATKEAG
jgi:hypothetical protein